MLDPRDASAYEADLPHCAGVRIVVGAGHSPHKDDPDAVVRHLESFLLEA